MEEKNQQPKKLRKLSKKQKGFVNDYVKTGIGVESALKNYDTDDYNVANQIAIENLQKPTIQNAIKSIAERIPDNDLVKVHLEGLKASKEVWKNNNESGEIELVSQEPDYAVRHKYLDSAYKIKGLYGDIEKPKEATTNTYNFFFNSEVQADIKEIEERIKAKLVKPNVSET